MPPTGRRSTPPGGRRYPRAARINEVLREVLAEAIERLADADERLLLLTITAVEADRDFKRATVLFASLRDAAKEALEENRVRLQATIAAQVRLKWTPQLSFMVDPAVSHGDRVEEILRNMRNIDGTGGGEGGPE